MGQLKRTIVKKESVALSEQMEALIRHLVKASFTCVTPETTSALPQKAVPYVVFDMVVSDFTF